MTRDEEFLLVYPFFHKDSDRDENFIILNRDRPTWLAANRTAVEIAQQLDGGASVESVASFLSHAYHVRFDQAQRDVRDVASRLENSGLAPRHASRPCRATALRVLFVHLTTRCNLACPHCYYASPSSADLPTKVAIGLIDELLAEGGESVVLSGGEPFLHPDIKAILRYAARKVHVDILTNGTLIDSDWASFLGSEIRPTIQLSLDGSNEEINDAIRGSGSFRRTLRAVELLQGAGLGDALMVASTVMRQNLHDLVPLIHLAERLGIPAVRFLPLRKIGNAQTHWAFLGAGVQTEDYESFFDEILQDGKSASCSVDVSCGLSGFGLTMPDDQSSDGIWCPVGKALTIGVEGDVFPCVLMMRDEFKLGNILHDSLSSLMASPAMRAICLTVVNRRNRIERCVTCNWRSLCQAGCMGSAFEHHQTLFAVDAFCEYRQKVYRLSFDRILGDFARRTCAVSPETVGEAVDAKRGSRATRFHGSSRYYEVLGIPIEVRSDSGWLADRFDQEHGLFARPRPAEEPRISFLLRSNGMPRHTYLWINGTSYPEDGEPCPWQHAFRRVNEAILDTVSGFFTFHAAVVAKDGRALAISGPSGSGKTTLALRLVEKGYGFLADDLCALNRATGLVHPFPRSLCLRSEDASRGDWKRRAPGGRSIRVGKQSFMPDQLGLPIVREPCRLETLVCLSSEDGPPREDEIRVGVRFGKGAQLLAELTGLKDVSIVDRDESCEEYQIRFAKGWELSRRISEILDAHQDDIWNVYRVPSSTHDFDKEPALMRIRNDEASFYLLRELKRETAARFTKNAHQPGLLFMEMNALLGGVRSYRLSVGKLDLETNLVASTLDWVDNHAEQDIR